MNSMRRPLAGWTGCVVRRGLVALVCLTPLPSFAAMDARPAEDERTTPSPAPKSEPAGAVAPTAIRPATSPSEDSKASKQIPKKLLRPLLGCWQLDGQERWTISRLDATGAQVVTKLMRPAKKRADRVPFPDYARRAAIPATLMYDAKQDNFGFSSAGRSHATLVVFKQSGAILEASLFSKRSSKHHYAFTGNSATLERCKAPGRVRAPQARPSPVPPRLK